MKRNQRRILLIQPPFYRLFKDTYSLDIYPLSLGYLAGMIRKQTNWAAMAYNADFSTQKGMLTNSYLTSKGSDNYINSLQDLSGSVWREIKSTISEYEPTIVGISATSPSFASACRVAKLAKETNEEIIVIVGGPHPSAVGADVLHCPDIDAVVKGEGENTLGELINAVDAQKEFNGIRGIIFRKGGHIVENAPREVTKDLDSLCFPNEEAHKILKDYEQYPLRAFRHIFATRGCPYDCFFCGSRAIWTRKVRFRSPENVVAEIEGLQKKGLRSVHFADDTFGANKQHTIDLCNALIVHRPKITWSCLLHVKLVDEETISLMRAAGCHQIEIGIESGNNEILKRMRKHITIEEALSACSIIKKHGIELYPCFIVGFPQETEATLKDTELAIRKIKCDHLVYSIFTPYLGTEAFEFCRENGLIGDDYDISLHHHQSPANCFCSNMTPERFRTLVSRIEKMVDRKNKLNWVKRAFSLNAIRIVRELGVGKTIKAGTEILLGK